MTLARTAAGVLAAAAALGGWAAPAAAASRPPLPTASGTPAATLTVLGTALAARVAPAGSYVVQLQQLGYLGWQGVSVRATTPAGQAVFTGLGSARYRLYVAARPATRPATSSVVAVGTGYLAPTTTIAPVVGGCLDLHGQLPGQPLDLTAGVKVAMVQARLGLAPDHPQWMDAVTVAAVARFQAAHHLAPSGVVDPATWRVLGLPESAWCADRWQARVGYALGTPAAVRISAMISYAGTYLGHRYVWGGAGTPAQGVDCSGLVLQSLFYAGLDPQPVPQAAGDNDHDVSSSSLYADPRLRHLPQTQMRRGDLVFYTDLASGVVSHVAIYLGHGWLLSAFDQQSGVAVTRLVPFVGNEEISPTVVRPFG